jgi:hypothetical protein
VGAQPPCGDGVSDATATARGARPHGDVETAFVGGEAVLLNVATGAVYALNPSASAVWLLLDGESSLTDIARELSDIVGLPADQLVADVEAAIDDFARQGLLAADASGDDATSGPFPLLPPPDP